MKSRKKVSAQRVSKEVATRLWNYLIKSGFDPDGWGNRDDICECRKCNKVSSVLMSYCETCGGDMTPSQNQLKTIKDAISYAFKNSRLPPIGGDAETNFLQNGEMVVPSFVQMVDGLWPNTSAYISIEIPFDFLDSPFEFLNYWDDKGSMLCIDLNEILEKRLSEGRCEMSQPSKEKASWTVSLLRQYAEALERNFVNGPDAYCETKAIEELKKDREALHSGRKTT